VACDDMAEDCARACPRASIGSVTSDGSASVCDRAGAQASVGSVCCDQKVEMPCFARDDSTGCTAWLEREDI